MDAPEDLSARILLRQILNTEPPRTPITRSVPSGQSSSSATRRSSRLSHKAAAQTPQAILRRSLKHKLTESITRKSLPAPRRPAVVLARVDQISTPMLFDDGETPRHILRNILRTEPVKSPVVHDQGPFEEQKPPSAASSTTTTRPSIELSTLDLPDVTIGNVLSTAKGLSRKRPRRSLNVTAFEKRLKGANDSEVRSEESLDEQLSLSSSSSTSLSLKTPFVDVQTGKKGLQRKISHRRKISEEEFCAAVNNRQTGGVPSLVSAELSETGCSEGFTLNLSRVSEPELTTDILNCNTALYPEPDATASNLSIAASQDKPAVTASQLQADIEQYSAVETEQSNREENAPEDFCKGEVETTPKEQKARHASRSVGAVDDAQEEEAEGTAHVEPDTCFGSTSEGGEGVTDATEPDEEEDAADSQPEEDVDAGSKSDEGKVEEVSQSAVEKETEAETDEGAADSQSQGEAQAETEEDKDLPGSQTEDEAESQSQGEVEIESREDENLSKSVKEGEEEESEQQTDGLLQHPLETGHQKLHQLEEDEDINESQNEDEGEREDEEQGEPAVEHISRRSRHSQAALAVPVPEAGEDVVDTEAAGVSFADSKSHRTFELGSDLDVEEPQSSAASSGQAESSNPGQSDPSCAENEPDADKENSSQTEEHLSGVSPEEAAPPEGGDEQEEWEEEEEEEEDDDLPSKTPPFVKVKRDYFYPDPSASPTVLKNVQASASEAAPAAKPAQARPRKKRPAKKRATLPKTYLMSVFRHFAKTKVSAGVYPLLDEVMDSFFDRLAADLETYAAHAKRKTIEVEDAVLLLKRQGYVNDKMPVEVLIEKYLRLEQRKLLIPIATSGNVVIPKKR